MDLTEAKSIFFREYDIDEGQKIIEGLSYLNKNVLNSVWDEIEQESLRLIQQVKENKKSSTIEKLFREFEVGSKEGRLLIDLAEAIVQIPDYYTTLRFIEDKMSQGDWSKHIGQNKSLIVNISSLAMKWGENYITEKKAQTIWGELNKRLGAKIVYFIIKKIVKLTLNSYRIGETPYHLKTASSLRNYDVGGFSLNLYSDEALTGEEAKKNFDRCLDAIVKWGKDKDIFFRKEVTLSIKLSSFYPRFEGLKIEDIYNDLYPKMIEIVREAQRSGINIMLEAEELFKSEALLTLFEAILKSKIVENWDGFGITVQSYDKRALAILRVLKEMAIKYERRLIIRLIKGDFWRWEIENAQLKGLENYPVFTRKESTDVSYLACVHKLFSKEYYDNIRPFFGTNNVHTLSAVMYFSGGKKFTLEKVKGVGGKIFSTLNLSDNIRLNIYAPIGEQKDMSSYFKRRLLENSSAESFINQLERLGFEDNELASSPLEKLSRVSNLRNSKIALPSFTLEGEQCRAIGIDLNYRNELLKFLKEVRTFSPRKYLVHSVIGGESDYSGTKEKHYPAFQWFEKQEIAQVIYLDDSYRIKDAAKAARVAFKDWSNLNIESRSKIILKLAELLEQHKYQFLDLCLREAGRTASAATEEIRQAIDYCYVHAQESLKLFKGDNIKESKNISKSFTYSGKGVVACLNDDVLRFSMIVRQIVATLLTGNTIIIKPNKQNVVMTYNFLQLLYKAGVPANVVQFIVGFSEGFEETVVLDDDVDFVSYRGDLKKVEHLQTLLLSHHKSPLKILFESRNEGIMFVDSTAELRDVVKNVVKTKFVSSGFNEKLTKIYLQEDIKEPFIRLLLNRIISFSKRDGAPESDYDVNAFEPDFEGVNWPALKKLKTFKILGLEFEIFKAKDWSKVVKNIAKTNGSFVMGIESRNDKVINLICEAVKAKKFYINQPMMPGISESFHDGFVVRHMLEERMYLNNFCDYKILSQNKIYTS